MTPASPGAVVGGLHSYGVTATYSVGSHQGRAVLSLDVTRPGTFAIAVSGSPPAGSDLAFGPSVASTIVRVVLPTILLLVLGVGLALAIFIVRIVRRSRQRAQLAGPVLGPGAPPYG